MRPIVMTLAILFALSFAEAQPRRCADAAGKKESSLQRKPVERVSESQARQLLTGIHEIFKGRVLAVGLDLMVSTYWDEVIKPRETGVFFNGLFHELLVSSDTTRRLDLDLVGTAISIVHEYGHLLGKGPKDDYHKTTVEGEADYFAGQEIKEVFRRGLLPLDPADTQDPMYAQARRFFSERGVVDPVKLDIYSRVALAKLRIMKNIFPGEQFNFHITNASVVTQTKTGYPDPQARIDTVLAGLLGLPRPRSWAVPKDFE